ncbi:J domain-containing protein [Aeromonas sanarellii]|uniref:J domain-containing protein n=1 Tax=Aeromonas sanarellii TaxID=633415 RepID=UPI0038D00FAF
MTTPTDSSILTAFGIIPADLDNQSAESVTKTTPGTGLMNPREYEDLLKKLRHLRIQEQSAEKTLTEIRIEKATLVREHIDRADHGQKQGIYDAAGMSKSSVTHTLNVKHMLMCSKVAAPQQLPSHAVLQDIAAKAVPQSVRAEVLSRPDITQREARELIQAAKQAAKPTPMVSCGAATIAPAASPAQPDPRLESYAVIGLLPSASDAVVKAAIRAAQTEHHPDHGGDADEFARIQSAAETIGELRREARAEAEATQAQRYREAIEALGGL